MSNTLEVLESGAGDWCWSAMVVGSLSVWANREMVVYLRVYITSRISAVMLNKGVDGVWNSTCAASEIGFFPALYLMEPTALSWESS
jgi:hypothetical protein